MLARLKLKPRQKDFPPYWVKGYLLWLWVGGQQHLFALTKMDVTEFHGGKPIVKLTHYASGMAFTGENLCEARVSPQQLVDEVVASHGEETVTKRMEAAEVVNDEQDAFQGH